MPDTPAHPVREHLAIVASTLDLAESDITDLRRVLEVAASTVEQAQSETTRAHFTSDRRTARTSLHSAAEMLAASRSASERGISLTIDIEERLISTRQHLHSARTRAVALTATDGSTVDLSRLPGRTVVYCYPRTGHPDRENPAGWDAIPRRPPCK